MVREIQLNDTKINITHFEEKENKNGIWISVTFNVTSEEYHDITTLLYKGAFDVKVPEKQIEFRGTIQQYSTSITNLYKKGQVGEYKLTLKEVDK
ncbi:DUF3219 family protein [Sporosarcina koreensis]|uniref:DUF3219 family protein n=1 Tax=Bacillales TaxID=1385 RepID=UPI0007561651|nr:DUF3219 family protein [Sporosarcina koreensis]